MKNKPRPLWQKHSGELSLDKPQNDYYENVSANLGIVQVILYFSLFAFVVLSFFANTDLITYQNFYYFFKDLNATAQTTELYESDSVTYPSGEQQSFTLYRKGLAVASRTSVSVFTATGKQAVSKIISYQNPIAVGSGRYLLVYEMGGTQYSLYNSYSQIHTGKTDRTILGAAVSESGMYALITESEEYTTEVSLYNSHFSLVNRYNKKGYVMNVALNANGSRIALLVSDSVNGRYETELEIYKPGESTSEAAVHVSSSVGLSCEFTSSGAISVLCGDGIGFYSQKGTLLSVFDFEGGAISGADLNEYGAALCLTSSAVSKENRLLAFDKNGKIVYNRVESGDIKQIARVGNSLYLLKAETLERLNIQSGKLLQFSCVTEQRRILAVNEEDVLLCSSKKAEYVRFR